MLVAAVLLAGLLIVVGSILDYVERIADKLAPRDNAEYDLGHLSGLPARKTKA
jgi:hypothetical protein